MTKTNKAKGKGKRNLQRKIREEDKSSSEEENERSGTTENKFKDIIAISDDSEEIEEIPNFDTEPKKIPRIKDDSKLQTSSPIQNQNVTRETLRKPTNRYFVETVEEKIGKNTPLFLHNVKKKFASVCTICGQSNHYSYSCPNSICFVCQNPGHASINCPFKNSKACVWCLRKGHDESTCPVREMNLRHSDIVAEVSNTF